MGFVWLEMLQTFSSYNLFFFFCMFVTNILWWSQDPHPSASISPKSSLLLSRMLSAVMFLAWTPYTPAFLTFAAVIVLFSSSVPIKLFTIISVASVHHHVPDGIRSDSPTNLLAVLQPPLCLMAPVVSDSL